MPSAHSVSFPRVQCKLLARSSPVARLPSRLPSRLQEPLPCPAFNPAVHSIPPTSPLTKPQWNASGPQLFLEFSRKCDDGSLSLVLDERGTETETNWISVHLSHTHTNPNHVDDSNSNNSINDNSSNGCNCSNNCDCSDSTNRGINSNTNNSSSNDSSDKNSNNDNNSDNSSDNNSYLVHTIKKIMRMMETIIGVQHERGYVQAFCHTEEGIQNLQNNVVGAHSLSHALQEERIRQWWLALRHNSKDKDNNKTQTPYAAVIWCSLPPNFELFSPETALKFLRSSKHEVAYMSHILSAVNVPTAVRAQVAHHILQSTNYLLSSPTASETTAPTTTAATTATTAATTPIDPRTVAESQSSIYKFYSSLPNANPNVLSWLRTHTYFGNGFYIEYVQGTIPVVLSAPHGGLVSPSHIPDRATGVMDTDWHTIELTCELFAAITDTLTPHNNSNNNAIPLIPHVIICHLLRTKIDANRNLHDSATHPETQQAWYDFHNFIEIAKGKATEISPHAYYFDIHGQSVSPKIMVGNLVRKVDFESHTPETLQHRLAHSSLRSLAHLKSENINRNLLEMLTGSSSIGHMLQEEGFECTPVGNPPYDWGAHCFYHGGYNVWRHGSFKLAHNINGTQLETPIQIRETREARERFSRAFTKVLCSFFSLHFGIDLRSFGKEGK